MAVFSLRRGNSGFIALLTSLPSDPRFQALVGQPLENRHAVSLNGFLSDVYPSLSKNLHCPGCFVFLDYVRSTAFFLLPLYI